MQGLGIARDWTSSFKSQNQEDSRKVKAAEIELEWPLPGRIWREESGREARHSGGSLRRAPVSCALQGHCVQDEGLFHPPKEFWGSKTRNIGRRHKIWAHWWHRSGNLWRAGVPLQMELNHVPRICTHPPPRHQSWGSLQGLATLSIGWESG